MKKRILYFAICSVFFVIYFNIFGFIWDRFMPFNVLADLAALGVLIFVNIPLSIISTEKLYSAIKNNS